MQHKEEKEALVLLVCKKIITYFILFFSFINIAYSTTKQEIIKDVETYLNNIKYLQSKFIQDDLINSRLSEGIFYLSRPNKLRIDYLNPFEASLYIDNKTVIYYDKELDEVHNIKTADTPLKFLLRNRISLNNKDFSVIDATDNNNIITISFEEKKDNHKLILTFKKSPMSLQKIKLITSDGQEIEMSLFDQTNTPIQNSTFVFKKKK